MRVVIIIGLVLIGAMFVAAGAQAIKEGQQRRDLRDRCLAAELVACRIYDAMYGR